MNRREFLSLGLTAAAGTCLAQASSVIPTKGFPPEDFQKAVATIESTKLTDVAARKEALAVLQSYIEAMKTGEAYEKFVQGGTRLSEDEVAAVHAKEPVLWWYDRAFDRVLEAVKTTKVEGDVPAVWYVYNMGVIVKTRSCTFSIDLCHRKAKEMTPYLDFALVTHNHQDHYQMEFVSALHRMHGPVITNFLLVKDWYVADERTLTFKDLKIHVRRGNHNRHLPFAVNCYEIECGGEKPYVIYHSGDCNNSSQLKPAVMEPDIFMGHCQVGLKFSKAWEVTKAKMMLPMHHQELGHLGGPYKCVGFNDAPLKIREELEKMGVACAIPVWGDRIV